MTGPNNYGHRMEILIRFLEVNPRMKRDTILGRLGEQYLYTFNRAKDTKRIVATEDSTWKNKYWVVNGKHD